MSATATLEERDAGERRGSLSGTGVEDDVMAVIHEGTGGAPGAGWERGVPVGYLREVAEYWRDGFDWRA
jgi:hypothetical protein